MNRKTIVRFWYINLEFWSHWSSLGLVLGFLFLAFSLSPSLVPRPFMLQGVASGIALSIGYAVGLGIMALWQFLELPEFRAKALWVSKVVAAVGVGLVVLHFYANATLWQNSVRNLMDMEPIRGVAYVRITSIAFFLWFFLVYLAAGLRRLYVIAANRVHKIVPRRVSYVIGGVLLTFFLLFTINGVLVTKAIDIADGMYAKVDQAIPDGVEPPKENTRSGSSESLVAWNDLGREGKYFVTGGPTMSEIEAVTSKSSNEPIRVYVGLSAAATPHAQAELALAELKRTKAFERNKLIIATPTGTGWVDEGAVNSLEYLYQGNTAIVGVQYSYLSSPVTLILDPNRARRSAKIVFTEIYDYWRSLPEDSRPELIIYGISLGSLGSEDSANIFSLLTDPIEGALWVGPPFANTFWPEVMRNRNKGTPAYLPSLDKGALVRVLGAAGTQTPEFGDWGPLKIVYLLHPSDAIVFFSFDLLYKEPDWLTGQRGADVSKYLKWYPFVTMWQIGLDILVTTNVPFGHGHNYSPTDYVRAWIELDENSNWSEEELASINQALGAGGHNRIRRPTKSLKN